jgi:hypothetical protein
VLLAVIMHTQKLSRILPLIGCLDHIKVSHCHVLDNQIFGVLAILTFSPRKIANMRAKYNILMNGKAKPFHKVLKVDSNGNKILDNCCFLVLTAYYTSYYVK